VYDTNPEENPDAYLYSRLTYLDVLQQRLKVMDSAAISLCMDNKMPIVVFNLLKRHNIKRVACGEDVGTTVHG
jgi:uridylate kinase